MGNYDSDRTGWATIVWLDPGWVTGWCVLGIDPRYLADPDRALRRGIRWCVSGEFGGQIAEQGEEIDSLFEMWPDAALGCESFELRSAVTSSDVLVPVKVWSLAEWFAHVHGKRRLFTQQAVMAHSMNQERMRELGLWEVGEGKDARMARFHAVMFARRAREPGKEAGELRRAAWPRLFS